MSNNPIREKQASKWPQKVTVGNVSVKVYKMKHPTNKSGWAYVLSYTTANGRKRQKFAEADAALKEARLIAHKLTAGHIEAADLSRGERDEYFTARKIVGEYPLLAALKEWATAKGLCGADLLTAAQSWNAANGNARKEITIPALVKAFLRDKERSGVDTKAGYARTLPRVADAFPDTLLHTLTAPELKEWLHSAFRQEGKKHVHPSTFNSHRRRMVTLWKWARDEGYLPKNAQTEIEQVKTIKEVSEAIGIFTVPEYGAILKLIKEKHPAYLATTVLAGFAGLRRTELHAQKWEHIDLKRGILRVTKAKRNTPSMRMVHLCPAAVEWLLTCKHEGELVSPPWALDRIREHARNSKIKCPANAFRHSFITYRAAATGNVDETSLEAGNSRGQVFKRYRELVSKDEGLAWFDMNPKAVGEIGEIEQMVEVAS